jgi:hypothetical protein
MLVSPHSSDLNIAGDAFWKEGDNLVGLRCTIISISKSPFQTVRNKEMANNYSRGLATSCLTTIFLAYATRHSGYLIQWPVSWAVQASPNLLAFDVDESSTGFECKQ